MQVVARDTLPTVRINDEVAAYVFEGSRHGDLASSAFVVDAAPGTGPRRHRHPYDEIFIVVTGVARLEADGEELEATAEQICVVPAGTPHTFRNAGTGRLLMVNVHTAAHVVTEWVDDAPGAAGADGGPGPV